MSRSQGPDQDGVRFVASWEGFSSCPYLDRLANPPVWTRGYGETENIHEGSRCVSKGEARHDLHRRLLRDFNPVKLLPPRIAKRLRQCEVNALGSLCYNEGPAILSEPDYADLAKRLRSPWALLYRHRKRIYREELPRWDVSGGAHVEGLARRRRAEIRLACSGVK